MDWLDDLLLSYNVSLYTPGVSGADEEITLTAIDKTDTEANELQAFSFSYRRAKTITFNSRQLPAEYLIQHSTIHLINMLHVNQLRAILRAHEPFDCKVWKKTEK